MRYPVLTLSECRELASERLAGGIPTVEAHWVGDGPDVDLSMVGAAAAEARRLMDEQGADSRKDKVEGATARHLYRALRHPPGPAADATVLDDPSFWRYLSLKWFWEFIEWREARAFYTGKHLRYIDGTSSTDCVLTRMYLRMSSLGGADHEALADILDAATDFWRSHVVRVRTATAPHLTRAFVRMQAEERMNTNLLRVFAKRINRTWTNVLLDHYDDNEARELLAELRTDHGLAPPGEGD